ncbi:MAG: FxLYD domain-containing protein [Salinibacter sp.]
MSRPLDTFWRVGGMVAVLGLIGVGLYTLSGDQSPPRTAGESGEEVALVSHEGKIRADGSLVVTGVVRNTSNQTHSRVKVAISLYDDANTKIGSTTTATTGLGPGKRWKFEAVVAQDSAARYEIDRVTWR